MHGTSVTDIVKHLITVLMQKEVDLAFIFLEALKKVSLLALFLNSRYSWIFFCLYKNYFSNDKQLNFRPVSYSLEIWLLK